MTPRELTAYSILAIDPGSAKCGLAVVQEDGLVIFRSIVTTDNLLAAVQNVCTRYSPRVVLVGNGTGSKRLIRALQDANLPAAVEVVEEYCTSEAARARYVAENPARGWQRILPRCLRTPPEPVDDYAAVILAERWRQTKSSEP